MKTMKKIASLLLALVMVFSLAIAASAVETKAPLLGGSLQTGSIIITTNTTTGATVNGRSFLAIRAMNATVSGNNYAYYIPAGMENFYKEELEISDAEIAGSTLTLDELVAEKINAMGDNSVELFAFGTAVYNWFLSDEGKAANAWSQTAVGANDQAVFDNLTMGYYIIVDVTTIDTEKNPAIDSLSAVIIRTPGEKVEVAVKTDPPTIDKKIDGDNDSDPDTVALVPYNNTSIGDVVPYVVTSDVPNMTPFAEYVYKVTDIMSEGLTYNDDLKVAINGIELNKGEHYTATVEAVKDDAGNLTGETKLVVDFIDFYKWHRDYMPHSTVGNLWLLTDGTYTNKAPNATAETAEVTYVTPYQTFLNTDEFLGKEIKLTYSATVNENAIIGIEGNPNAVTLEYSRDPKNATVTGKTVEHETRTFTTGVKLYKVDENKAALAGAKFEIIGKRTNIVLISGQEYLPSATGTYYKLISGRYTEDAPTEDTASVYSTEVWYALNTNPVSYTQTSPVGLDAGAQATYLDPTGNTKINTYELVTFTDRPIEDTAAVNADAFVDDNGILTFKGLGAGEYTITELVGPGGYNMLRYPIYLTIDFTAPVNNDPAVWSGTYRDSLDEQVGAKELKWEAETGVLSLSVENRAGSELPGTGGIGTTIFYVLGGILVIGAAVLLITKKRVGAR